MDGAFGDTNMTGPLARGKAGSTSLNHKLITAGVAPVETVQAQGTLTIAEAVTAGDTMTIGYTAYLFVADGTAANAGDIDMGADEAATKLNIVKALKGTDGINGGNVAVLCGSTFTGDDLTLTAKAAGAAGNALVTTETFAGATNVFDAAVIGTTRAGAGSVLDKSYEVGDMVTAGVNVYLCTAKTSYGVTTWMYWAMTAL